MKWLAIEKAKDADHTCGCENCSGLCQQLDLWPKPKKLPFWKQLWEDLKFPWSRVK